LILLGIETASELVGVTLADDAGPRAGVWVTGRRRHAEALAPAIAHVLDQVGMSLADVEVVAVDVGPGLFTGLRVGVASAQGLAQGLGVGVIGVTSVDVLARSAYAAGWPGPVAAVVDARRGEVFGARYRGPTDQSHPLRRWMPAELAASLRADAAPFPGLLVVGNGALRYAGDFGGLRLAAIADPSPRALVEVAAGRLAAGERPVPPADVRPVYLREADARINWVQR
jgi:tRNA threonylcarbamoyladenosine biosynthesis protein TsaB